MFSATVHIQYVSQSPVKIYSATNIKLYISNAAVHVSVHVWVHGRVLTLKLVFSVQGLLLVFPRRSELSLSVCTADVRSESLPHCFPPVARPGHCFCPSLSLWLPSWSHLWEQSRQASPQQRPLHEHTHRNIKINTLTAEVQNETNICQLTAAFSVLPVARTPPSSLLSTSMKSFFETEQRIFALFLSDPPASFTFSCTVFWCFLTALNSWTTPLNEGGPH